MTAENKIIIPKDRYMAVHVNDGDGEYIGLGIYKVNQNITSDTLNQLNNYVLSEDPDNQDSYTSRLIELGYLIRIEDALEVRFEDDSGVLYVESTGPYSDRVKFTSN